MDVNKWPTGRMRRRDEPCFLSYVLPEPQRPQDVKHTNYVTYYCVCVRACVRACVHQLFLCMCVRVFVCACVRGDCVLICVRVTWL